LFDSTWAPLPDVVRSVQCFFLLDAPFGAPPILSVVQRFSRVSFDRAWDDLYAVGDSLTDRSPSCRRWLLFERLIDCGCALESLLVPRNSYFCFPRAFSGLRRVVSSLMNSRPFRIFVRRMLSNFFASGCPEEFVRVLAVACLVIPLL